VGHGLDAAAGEVEVRDRVRVEDGEGVQTLGRHVHVAAVGGRGGDEEDPLGSDEHCQLVGDRVEDPSHQVRTRGSGIAEEPNGGRSSDG
jgi:hypothetical protein